MKYQQIYNDLMLRAKDRVYLIGVHEKHHILPKCMGGTNQKSNIAILTYREHFLAHWLLVKFTEGEFLRKMRHALSRLTTKSKFHSVRVISGWQYELAKKSKSDAMIGNQYPKGYKHAKESRDKMSDAWTRREPVSNETRAKQSKARIGNTSGRGNKGKPKPLDWRKQMSGGGNGRAKRILCVTDGLIFQCIGDASKFYNICHNSITSVCMGRRSSVKNVVFKYL